MAERYDFSGWATKNDLLCSDGRTIRRDAFKDCDGMVVPLVWSHIHNDPDNVLGHALLKNEPEGVKTYCTFNDTPRGRTAKALVEHGDITNLSIYANKLKQKGGDVLHGVIREVSLVLSGANPGALIDYPSIEHSDDEETEAYIYTDEGLFIAHSDDSDDEVEGNEEVTEPEELSHEDKEEKDEDMADEAKNTNTNSEDKTVQDVFDSMTEEQKNVCYFMIGQALEDAGVDVNDEGENEDMKHNVFDYDYERDDVLTHADQADILNMAKQPGMTFQSALNAYAADNGFDADTLQHDGVSVSGFVQPGVGVTGYTVDALFPEYKDVRPGAPELITNDQGWVGTVLGKVHKSPISRIRTQQVDIRNIDSLRAKGYKKGNQKAIAGNFQLVRRTTDPQTVYVKSQLHRDDVVDITDFDYVQYLYNIDRMNLNEELAMAIMVGDRRSDEAEDKIFPEHIRPIWTDDELFTMHYDLDVEAMKATLQGTETGSYFGDNYVYAEALIEKVLYAREKFKGTGTPDFYMTPHMLNVMLLARDRNGRRIFSSKAELASALNVGQIITAEQFTDLEPRTDDQNHKHKLLGLCVNLADYSLGSTKGGEITHFTDFDIDFNLMKSLLETRCSGALTRVYSAIAIEEPVSGN
jgi:hypothetical protein